MMALCVLPPLTGDSEPTTEALRSPNELRIGRGIPKTFVAFFTRSREGRALSIRGGGGMDFHYKTTTKDKVGEGKA
jgi:hypothetical protein